MKKLLLGLIFASCSILDGRSPLDPCGNGILQSNIGEGCDDGNQNGGDGCDPSCQPEPGFCGNGVLDGGAEECDDGNAIDEDDCTNLCTNPRCGDSIKQSDEQCDDGNENNSDECTNFCTSPTCGDFVTSLEASAPEQCDDGNQEDDDLCNSLCELSSCGDGFVQSSLGEECDSLINNGSCHSDCQLPRCGDGVLDSNEECDDGNVDPFDGCSSICKLDLLVDCRPNNPSGAPFVSLGAAINASLGQGQLIEIVPGSICDGADISKSVGFIPFLDPTVHPDHRLDAGLPIIRNRASQAALKIPANAPAQTTLFLFSVQIGQDPPGLSIRDQSTPVILESGNLFAFATTFTTEPSTARLPIINVVGNLGSKVVLEQSSITSNLDSLNRFLNEDDTFLSVIQGGNLGVQCGLNTQLFIDKSVFFALPGGATKSVEGCKATISNNLFLLNGKFNDPIGGSTGIVEVLDSSEITAVYNTFIENDLNLMTCANSSNGTFDSSIAKHTTIGINVSSNVGNLCSLSFSNLNAGNCIDPVSGISLNTNDPNNACIDSANPNNISLSVEPADVGVDTLGVDVFTQDFNADHRFFGAGPDMGAIESL